MADNFLENRYEEVFGKGTGAKLSHSRPGLEALLKSSRETRSPQADYKAHPLQAEAILRALSYAFPEHKCDYELTAEGKLLINIDAENPFQAGRIYEVINLKATEMGLFSRILSNKESTLVIEINR